MRTAAELDQCVDVCVCVCVYVCVCYAGQGWHCVWLHDGPIQCRPVIYFCVILGSFIFVLFLGGGNGDNGISHLFLCYSALVLVVV